MSSRGLQFKTVDDGATYKSVIHINSQDRENDFQNSNDFRINLNPTIKNIYGMEVVKVEMIQSVYPVNANNNILYWIDQTGFNRVSYLTPGVYTTTTLAVEVGLQMTADTTDGGTYTAVIDPLTKKLVITATGGLPFTLIEGLPANTNNLLGVGSDNETGNPLTTSRLPDLSYPRNVSIRSSLVQSFRDDIFHTNSSKQDKLTTILVEVPLDAQFGDLIAYEPETKLRFSVKSRALDYILFKLENEDEELIDNNNMDWSITIALYSFI